MGRAYSPREPFQGSHSCAVSSDLGRHSGGHTSAVTLLADSLLVWYICPGDVTVLLQKPLLLSTARAFGKLYRCTHRPPRAQSFGSMKS